MTTEANHAIVPGPTDHAGRADPAGRASGPRPAAAACPRAVFSVTSGTASRPDLLAVRRGWQISPTMSLLTF